MSFKSSELTAPLLNFPQWDRQECSDGYYLIAQKGKIVSDTGPTIFNSRGELIWADDSYGVVFNLQIQTYKGENYITFWSSPEGSSHGYGRGDVLHAGFLVPTIQKVRGCRRGSERGPTRVPDHRTWDCPDHHLQPGPCRSNIGWRPGAGLGIGLDVSGNRHCHGRAGIRMERHGARRPERRCQVLRGR